MRFYRQSIRHPRVNSFATGLCVLSLLVATAHASDMQTVTMNVITAIPAPDDSTVLGYLAHLNADGSFNDIDYSDTGENIWSPFPHIPRLKGLIKAYTTPSSSFYHNEGLLPLAKILRAYDYWISNDYQSANWWWNEIYTPQHLSQAMLMLQQNDSLSTSRLNSGMTIVSRAYRSRSDNTGTNVGENRVGRADSQINRGLLTSNTSLVRESFGAVGDTLVTTTGEGIQPDGSYHQHGALLYGGGYGLDFSQDAARIAGEGAGTAYGIAPAKIRVLTDFLLDGQQWFTRGDTYDLSGLGRGISRTTAADKGLNLIAPVANAISLSLGGADGYRQPELQTMYTRLTAAQATHVADPATALSGNRQFWRSDIMVHQRPAYYSSVKTISTRTLDPELMNNENWKGLHGYDGVNLTLRTGNEYDNIQPVWDWYRLPGSTTERGTYSLAPSTSSRSSYSGGVSDGVHGATAFKHNRRNVSAQKAWFFFDNEYVALGSNIDAPLATSMVATSINQTLLNGAVTYKTTAGGPVTLSQDSTATPTNLAWVNHDSVGYFFLEPVSTATIQIKGQTGNWYDINHALPSTMVSADVFSLDVSHGGRPNDAAYMYIVVPGLTAAQMDNYAVNMPVSILRNDAMVQAVRQNTLGITEAAFYDADTLTISPDFTLTQVTSGVGSLVMLDEEPGNLLNISVSSPEALAETLQFCTSLHLEGFGATWLPELGYTTLTFTLAGGDLAGATVTHIYAIVPEPASGMLLLIAVATLLVSLARRRTLIDRQAHSNKLPEH